MPPLTLQNVQISRVLIVEDNPAAREGYGYSVEELGLEPVAEQGPIENIADFLKGFRSKADALLCDFHLMTRDYARFNGDVLAAECFKNRIPGLLCTTYTDINVMLNKSYLRYIPVLLNTNSPAPKTIVASYKRCLDEMAGVYHPTRKPWRTLIRVEEMDEDGKYFYVVVSGWDPSKKMRLYLEHLPEKIRLLIEPGKRLHAQVNVGAESYAELYFDEWEPD